MDHHFGKFSGDERAKEMMMKAGIIKQASDLGLIGQPLDIEEKLRQTKADVGNELRSFGF